MSRPSSPKKLAPRAQAAASSKLRKKPGPKKGTPAKNRIDLPSSEAKRIHELAMVGATLEQIASVLRISERTLHTKLRENPELLAAYKNGQNEALVFMEGKLFNQIRNDNLTAIIFGLKCRGGWREGSDLNLKLDEMLAKLVGNAMVDKSQSAVDYSVYTDAELAELKQLLQRVRDRVKAESAAPEARPN